MAAVQYHKALINAISDDIYFEHWEVILERRRQLRDKTLARYRRKYIQYLAGSDAKPIP